MEIVTGKDLLIQRRELLQGSRDLTREELMQNASKLAAWVAERVPGDVEFVLVLSAKDSDEMGATASNCTNERTERILKKAEKRVRKARVG